MSTALISKQKSTTGIDDSSIHNTVHSVAAATSEKRKEPKKQKKTHN